MRTLIFILLLCAIETMQAQCTHPDYDELIKLYNATSGEDWSNNHGWKEGASGISCDPCDFDGVTWDGITCDQGRVTGIDLRDNSLIGFIPDLQLQELSILKLQTNQLEGEIPDFSGLPNLEELNLAANSLRGGLPDFMGLQKLKTIFIRNNGLSGAIPKFNHCPNLEIITLNDNQFNGTIPNFDAPNLKILDLSGNIISGFIPDFKQHAKLQSLILNNNLLAGEIPNFKLTELWYLNLSNNGLAGALPDLINCQKLANVFLSNNFLSGEIPEYTLPELTKFWAVDNFFSGQMNAFLGCPKMRTILLSDCNLTGPFPDFSAHSNLQSLVVYLDGNNLSGCYPESICDLSQVSLTNNVGLPFYGDFEAFCEGEEQTGAPCGDIDDLWAYGIVTEDCECDFSCEHPDVESLIAFYESFNGDEWDIKSGWDRGVAGNFCSPCRAPSDDLFSIQRWWGVQCNDRGRVVCLDFDGNTGCDFLGLNGNNLNGTIPDLNLEYLETLILSNNEGITGAIPNFTGLPNLKSFQSVRTSLSGTIPVFSNVPKLEQIRISFNALSGEVPDLSHLDSLKSFTAFDNNLSGCFPDFACDLEVFDTRENIQLPWMGDHTFFCDGALQTGAPCALDTLNPTAFIDENCICSLMSSIIDFDPNINILYPNPAKDILRFSQNVIGNKYSILSLDGKLMHSGNIEDGGVNIQSLKEGAYFINIQWNDGKKETLKFVKF